MTLPLYYLSDSGEIACSSSPAYEITGTEIVTHQIPMGTGLACPAPGGEESIIVGHEHPDWWDWTLPRVAEIMQRIVPFAVTWCAPAFAGCDAVHPHGCVGFVGLSYHSASVAVVRSTCAPREAVSTAFHEAYHLIEHEWPEVGDVLDTLSDHAMPWPGDYLSRPNERRARLFESFAMHLSEGGAVPLAGAVPAMLGAIYSGEIGRKIAANRAPKKPSRMSRIRELCHV